MAYYFAILGTRDNPLFEHTFSTSKLPSSTTTTTSTSTASNPTAPPFPPAALAMNQFIVHSSLDIVDEIQWTTGCMYLRQIDRFYNNYISCFVTGSGARFLLLHNPDPNATHNAHLFPLAHLNPPVSAAAQAAHAAGTGNGAPLHPPPFTASPYSSTASLGTGSVGSSEKRSSSVFSGLTGGGGGSSSGASTPTSGGGVASNPTSAAAEEAVRQFFAEVYESWVKTCMNPFYIVDAPVTSRVFRGRVAGAARKWL